MVPLYLYPTVMSFNDFYFFTENMTSQIEGFNMTQYTPLYENEQLEGENMSMETTHLNPLKLKQKSYS